MNDRAGLQFGDFTLDGSERLLLRDGCPVPLTPKAFDVLVALTTKPGRLMTKDEILREVWPDSFVEESNLAYHVFALRRALGDTADGERYVQTVPKRGYRFVAHVIRVNGAHGVEREGGESVSGSPSGDPGEQSQPQADTASAEQGGSKLFGRAAALWLAREHAAPRCCSSSSTRGAHW